MLFWLPPRTKPSKCYRFLYIFKSSLISSMLTFMAKLIFWYKYYLIYTFKYKECLCRRPRFYPWVRKIPWPREWLPTPVFLLEESHGQRSLVVYSSKGLKELDTTEQFCRLHSLLIFFLLRSQFCIQETTVFISKGSRYWSAEGFSYWTGNYCKALVAGNVPWTNFYYAYKSTDFFFSGNTHN